MSDIVLVDNKKNTLADTVEILYTAPSGPTAQGVKIKAFTAANSSATSVSYKAYIYDSAGAAVDPVVPLKIVVKDKSDYAPGAVNHVIPAGGTLRMESSQADALNFYVTGSVQEASSV